MARKPRPKIARNGSKVDPATLALPPFPPPNPGSDLIELRSEAGREDFASKYISPEELEYLRTERKGKVLSADEKIAILEMAVAGLEPSVIGTRIGRAVETVRNFLSRYRPRNTIARAYIESKSDAIARKVVKNANVEESLEILHRINVLPKPNEKVAPTTSFSIVVGNAVGGPSIPSQAQIEASKE